MTEPETVRLDEQEAKVLRQLLQSSTSTQIAGQVSMTWQLVVSVIGRLERKGLVSRRRYGGSLRTGAHTKYTYYDLTPDGRAEAEARSKS